MQSFGLAAEMSEMRLHWESLRMVDFSLGACLEELESGIR